MHTRAVTRRTVLISGAGIAGATLAYWLVRHGFSITLVELSGRTRSSGAPVDVRAEALQIVAAMGVLPRLRAAATTTRRTVVVDHSGAPIAQLAAQNSVARGDTEADVELARPELAQTLLSTVTDDVEIILGDSIASVGQDDAGVDVSFESGLVGRFDLVVGADGSHSRTRRLVFGDQRRFVRHLGLYFGAMPVPGLPDPPADTQHYNVPGRSVTIHPVHGTPLAAFIFRSPAIKNFDHRNLDQHRQLIMQCFAGDRWRTPELLEYVRGPGDIYFDAISRTALPAWSSGRVGLVGDAASAVSLLGDGSTKAIIGGYTLAEELASTHDHLLAFRRYQHRHQRRVAKTWQVHAAARFLVPATSIGIGIRNRALKAAGMITLHDDTEPAVGARSSTRSTP